MSIVFEGIEQLFAVQKEALGMLAEEIGFELEVKEEE